MKIIKFDSIDSTNTYCSSLINSKADIDLPFAVISREQYAGRGRFGKDFFSPANSGIYLSFACEGGYEIKDLQKITIIVSALTHQILSKYSNKELKIKWVNDIYKDDKKIAGILTERVDDKSIQNKYYIIVGIGINIFPNTVPDELNEIIGFLMDNNETDANLLDKIAMELLNSLDATIGNGSNSRFLELICYYKKYCTNPPIHFFKE